MTRDYGKDHLRSETDRSGGRFVGGKLIHQRSTEYGTETELLVRVCLTYFASSRWAPTAKALASSNRRRRKAGSSIR